MGQVYGDSLQISKTPSLCSSATAYAAKDELGGIQTLAAGHPARVAAGVILQNISIVDSANEATGLELHFFKGMVTAGGDNASFSVSASEMADNYAGTVVVSSTSYTTAGAVVVCSQENIGMYIGPADGDSTVYALPVVKSATTYTSHAMTFKYGFLRDL